MFPACRDTDRSFQIKILSIQIHNSLLSHFSLLSLIYFQFLTCSCLQVMNKEHFKRSRCFHTWSIIFSGAWYASKKWQTFTNAHCLLAVSSRLRWFHPNFISSFLWWTRSFWRYLRSKVASCSSSILKGSSYSAETYRRGTECIERHRRTYKAISKKPNHEDFNEGPYEKLDIRKIYLLRRIEKFINNCFYYRRINNFPTLTILKGMCKHWKNEHLHHNHQMVMTKLFWLEKAEKMQ